MQSKKYKFYDTVIEIITPEAIIDNEPYSRFLSDGNADFSVSFEYVSALPNVHGNTVSDSEITYVAEKDKGLCWYKHHGKEGYYAYRSLDTKGCVVQVLDKYKGKLWDGALFNLLGFEELIARKNGIVLHASAIIKNGKAVLFTAPCGTGKSTQASLWEKYASSEIINGDKALIKIDGNRIISGGLPFSGSSAYCKNIYAPLSAVISLGQSTENILRRLSPAQAAVAILKGNYRSGLTESSSEKTLDIINEVCSHIPVYRFDCLPDESAVICLERELNL